MKCLASDRTYSKCPINEGKLLLFLEEVVISRSLRLLRSREKESENLEQEEQRL